MVHSGNEIPEETAKMPAIVFRCLLQIGGVAVFELINDFMVMNIISNSYVSPPSSIGALWLLLILEIALYALIVLTILAQQSWAPWLIALPILWKLFTLVGSQGHRFTLGIIVLGLLSNAFYELVTDQEAIAWLNPIKTTSQESTPPITEHHLEQRSPKPKTIKKPKSKSALESELTKAANLSGESFADVTNSDANSFYRSANFHVIVAFITFVFFPLVGFFWLPIVWSGKNQFFVWRNSQVEIEAMSQNTKVWITGAVIANFFFWFFVNMHFR